MRYLALLVLWLAMPVTVFGGKPEKPRTEDTAAWVVPVSGRYKLGHACPISATEAYTADHMITVESPAGPQVWPLLFSQEGRGGGSGTLVWSWSDKRRDLALVTTVDTEFVKWYPRSKRPPEIGEKVLLVGFKFERGLTPYVVEARVLNVVAGLIVYNNTPGPGSSGSCVLLAESGELVGVNHSSFSDSLAHIGMASGVYPAEDTPDVWREKPRQ